MKWQQPPIIKLYEALGSVTDGRVHLEGNEAKIYSSSGNKYYDVKYNPDANSITSNDNASYWKGYLGYPIVAFLLAKGILELNQDAAESLKGISWKDVNTKFKNDFTKTESYVREEALKSGKISLEDLDTYLKTLQEKLGSLDLNRAAQGPPPPKAY
jgi:hypothetical protein